MTRAPSSQCLAYLRAALGLPCTLPTRRLVRGVPRRSFGANAALAVEDHESDTDSRQGSAMDARSHRTHRTMNVSKPWAASRSRTTMTNDELQALSVSGLRNLMMDCQNSKYWQSSIDLYQKFYDRPSTHPAAPVDAPTFHLYVRAQSQVRNQQFLDSARGDLLDDCRNAIYNTETANILLQNLISRGELSKALRALETLHQAQFPLDTTSYNTILSGCRRGMVNLDRLRQILHLMQTRDVHFDVISYNILIAAYGDAGDVEAVRRYFASTVVKKIANTSTYNTVISQELARGNWQTAWSLLGSMKKARVLRDNHTYTPFLSYLSQPKCSSQIPELLAAMKLDRVSIDMSTYNIMLHIALFSRSYDVAKGLLDDIIESRITPTERTFHTITRFYRQCTTEFLSESLHLKLGHFIDKATSDGLSGLAYERANSLQFSRSVWDNQGLGGHSAALLTVPPSATLCEEDLSSATKYIQHLMNKGNWQTALARFDRVRTQGVLPPIQMIVSVLVGLVRLRRFKEARNVCHESRVQDLAAKNPQFQTAVLGTFQRSTFMQDLQSTIRFSSLNDVRLDMIFYTAAAWRLYRDNRFHEGVSLLRHALSLGLAFDLVAGIVLMECFAKTRDLVGTVWALQMMKDNKVILDQKARRRFRKVVKTLDNGQGDGEIEAARDLLADLSALKAKQRLDETITSEAVRMPVVAAGSRGS